jgi:hypothetical protein
MEDDVIDQTAAGYMELARRLEAYADLRLSPSSAATTRMRSAVMNAAHRRAALIHADATFDAVGDATAPRAADPDKPAGVRLSWRRPAAALFAGVFALAVLAGSVYGARAGGPLYAARLWVEMANLPADVRDRAQAEVNRLDERIKEAQEASSAGDVSGTEAALAAYSSIVVEAAAGTGADATADATLEVAVTRHVVVLTVMVDSVPGQARGAAEQALTSSTKALDDLDNAGKPSSDRHPATNHTAHNAQGDPDGVVDAADVVPHDPWATNPGSANRTNPGAPAPKSTTQSQKPAKDAHVPPRATPTPPKNANPGNNGQPAETGAHGPAADQARP